MGVGSDRLIEFERRFDAERAELKTPGFWTLTNVTENAPEEVTRKTNVITLPTTITIEDLRNQSGQQSIPPFWELQYQIKANETAGFSARKLHLTWHKLLSLPILLLAMTFIAAGTSMNFIRAGGNLRLLITGATIGFAVFFADSVMTAFGEVGTLPVILAAWTVPSLSLLLGIQHLARIEDG